MSGTPSKMDQLRALREAKAVTDITEMPQPVTQIRNGKRGRPRKPDALSNAERQRRHRERKRAKACCFHADAPFGVYL